MAAPLLLEGTVADFAEPVEEDRPGKGFRASPLSGPVAIQTVSPTGLGVS